VHGACKAIKPAGGIVHFYGFVTVSDSLENMKLKFRHAVETSGRKLGRITSARLVRATAPYEWQAVIDAKIC
jgi:tRNA G37 N-methylase Trm5